MNYFKEIHDMNWEVLGELVWNDLYGSQLFTELCQYDRRHWKSVPVLQFSLRLQTFNSKAKYPLEPTEKYLSKLNVTNVILYKHQFPQYI